MPGPAYFSLSADDGSGCAQDHVVALPTIGIGDPLVKAVEIFQHDPELRLLPVLDADRVPVGGLFERDMRRILFNPYGHALLKNPSFGARLDEHIKACPVVDAAASTYAMIDAYAAAGRGCEGLIVVRDGRYAGIVSGALLLQLAAQQEADASRRKAIRFERIDEAGARFRADATALASELVAVAGQLSRTAEDMVARATRNGEHSASMATAASQAAQNMAEIAAHGTELDAIFQSIENQVESARTATVNAVSHAERAALHTHALTSSADDVRDVTALIDAIARATAMLALNAGIEAARASEGATGFAAVASEVKSLASQTREAAAHIAERITGISTTIIHVSEDQAQMGSAIDIVGTLSTSLFTAVTRQSEATRSIAANVAEAKDAASHVHLNASEINRDAMTAAEGAQGILDFASALSGRAALLKQRVTDFIDVVQAA